MNVSIDVYEGIVKLNRRGLDEAIDALDFNRMHQCFNRLTHALEQIEIYQRESAPVYCGDHLVTIGECGCKL